MLTAEEDVLVTFVAQTYYNMTPIVGSIKRLCGYSDRNYVFTDSTSNCSYVLKIVNEEESEQQLTGECLLVLVKRLNSIERFS